MRHVASIAECNPFDLWYASEERGHTDILCLVMLAIEQQRRYLYLVHLVNNRPVF